MWYAIVICLEKKCQRSFRELLLTEKSIHVIAILLGTFLTIANSDINRDITSKPLFLNSLSSFFLSSATLASS